MVDDEAGKDVEPGEQLTPPGPRRSSYTPPSNDRESLEAAASVFNDDAIAAAMAAELAKVASGPIPIVRPIPREPEPERAVQVEPDPVAPVEPEIVATPTPEPIAQVEPGVSAASTPESSAPSAPAFGAAPSHAAASAPEPSVPFVPLTPFEVPTAIVPPAPAQPRTNLDDVPPPYLGAPAPTVPAADAPPPPGYVASVPSFVPRAQGVPDLPPEPVDDEPPSPDRPPQRRSLDNAELIRAMRGEDQSSGGTLDAIEQLQAELRLRDREAKAFSAWESSMLALGTPDAVAAVEDARPEFSDLLGSAPTPTTQATPVVPATPDVPVTPKEAEHETDHDEFTEGGVPESDEPSLEGTAFDELFAPLREEAEPDIAQSDIAESEETLVQFPGLSPSPAEPAPAVEEPRLSPPVLIEPPSPESQHPVEPASIGLIPNFEMTAWGESSATDDGAEQPLAAAAPTAPSVEPAAPAPFDALLTGEGDGDSPPGAPWPSPPSDQPVASTPEQAIDPETGGPLPFGSGVERDEAVGPSPSISAEFLGPVSVDTSGVAVIGAPIVPVSSSFPVSADAPTAGDASIAAAVVGADQTPRRVFLPEPTGQEPTPLDHRVGRAARMFWLWFASNSSIVAVVFGGIIFSLGMSLRQAIVATLAGVALSFIPLGLGTLAGKRSGQPTMVISRATFGVVGNVVPAAIGLLSRLFWGAALLWLVGAGVASILTGAGATDGFSEHQLTFIMMALGFILVIVCAYYGYALIARVQLVISILSAVLIVGFIALTGHEVDMTRALRTGDGSWILTVTGAVLVFSFVGLVWANSSSDLARYQRPGSSGAAAMLWATFGTALPTFVLIAYGAVLAASSPKIAAGLVTKPLTELGHLLPGWYPVPLLAATALSLLSGAVLSIYSGGFALQAIGMRVPRSAATLVVGLFVLIVALVLTISVTDFAGLFRDFATTLAVPVAAWAGIFGAEIMIRNRRFDSRSLLRRGGVYEDVRWSNLGALVVITAIGLGLLSATVGWLGWEGYLFSALGVPLSGAVATSDLGVLVALLLGLIFPIVAGVPAVRRQESATRPAE